MMAAKHRWSPFRKSTEIPQTNIGPGYSFRPDRLIIRPKNEQTTIMSIYNRIAVDCASYNFVHARVSEDGFYQDRINSDLGKCLTLSANIDQTGRALIQDCVLSMLDEGVAAVVPIETKGDPLLSENYKIYQLRVGRIVTWYPQDISVDVYDERTGQHSLITVPKRIAAIIENPFSSVMNSPNSTVQRLTRKLALLDAIDEQSSSGKLDIIIQLPYAVKTDLGKNRAEERRKSIEEQLTGSKYGIAYIDSTEHVTQLNRPAENNLMDQIKYLYETMYRELNLTDGILNGTADAKTMQNYQDRIIRVIVLTIAEEMTRKFLSKTAISQYQAILPIRDPFALVPISDLSEIVDKFTRNEIMTSNEVRQRLGVKPAADPNADVLRNKNLKEEAKETVEETTIEDTNSEEGGKDNG